MNFKPLSVKQSVGISGSVILLDQLTKLWVASSFSEPDLGDAHVLIPRFLQIIFRVNTGAAFSVFTEHPFLLAIFSSCVATGLFIWSVRLQEEERILRWPLSLIFGGAVGNLVDRYRIGHVVDFIDAHWDDRYHFPTFNVADSAICIGMALLILMSLMAPNRK